MKKTNIFKKTLLIILMILLLMVTVSADGMGIINNLNFGNIVKGNTYTREIMFFPFDTDYYPYTEIPLPEDLRILVEITSEDNYAEHIDFIEAKLNQYTKTLLTLKIPRRARKGYYKSKVCAIEREGFFNVGACAYLEYTVVSKGMIKRNKRT